MLERLIEMVTVRKDQKFLNMEKAYDRVTGINCLK